MKIFREDDGSIVFAGASQERDGNGGMLNFTQIVVDKIDALGNELPWGPSNASRLYTTTDEETPMSIRSILKDPSGSDDYVIQLYPMTQERLASSFEVIGAEKCAEQAEISNETHQLRVVSDGSGFDPSFATAGTQSISSVILSQKLHPSLLENAGGAAAQKWIQDPFTLELYSLGFARLLQPNGTQATAGTISKINW